MPTTIQAQEKPAKQTRKTEKKAARKARRAATQHLFQIGVSGTRVHFSDANLSSQLYGGWGAGGIISLHTYSPRAYVRALSIAGRYTPVDALTAGPGGYVAGGGGEYTYTFKLKPWWDGRLQPYLGPTLSGMYNARIISLGNSTFNDDFALSLGVTGHIRSDFKLFKKPAFATGTLQLPLFSYLLSDPLYGVSLSGTFERFAPIGVFSQMKSEVNLARQIGQTQNFLQIGYNWDYYAYSKESNPLRFAQHGLTLALLIRM
ncbi:MAG: hypothetical protein AAFV07_03305 [Bacteroidota bacterium]